MIKKIIPLIIIFIHISCNNATNVTNVTEKTEEDIKQEQKRQERIYHFFMDIKFNDAQAVALKYNIDNKISDFIITEYTKNFETEFYNFINKKNEPDVEKDSDLTLADFIIEISNQTGYDKSIVSGFIIDYKCIYENDN